MTQPNFDNFRELLGSSAHDHHMAAVAHRDAAEAHTAAMTAAEKEEVTVAQNYNVEAPTARDLVDALILHGKMRDATAKLKALGSAKADDVLKQVAEAHAKVKEAHEAVATYAADLKGANPGPGEDKTDRTADKSQRAAQASPATLDTLEKALKSSGKFRR
jgi:hypothetical protein